MDTLSVRQILIVEQEKIGKYISNKPHAAIGEVYIPYIGN